ncbi:DUF6612 family protein [Nocardiopsis composta]|uniref:Outer membrane lipoprotein-sorting protein n=1 Tax=Nocardiopsis composta TaxID=157465 RepID=A0A7W8VDV1_9ACTN|nr:DUF6612 family protein [Nocardiopsis composta]MBB5432398.1 outer membrane lipoprotein-sorting protein [Nocardiopsis composta]
MKKKFATVLVGAGTVLAVGGCGMLPGAGGSGGGGGEGGGGGLSSLNPVEIVAKAVDNTEQAESYTASMTMSGSMQGQSLDTQADIEYTSDPEPTVKMSTTAQGTEAVMLMRGSEMVMEDPGGSGWMRMDLGEMGMSNAGSQDPLSEVEKLLAAEDVQESGSEEVNGVGTTRYSGSYSAAEAASKIGDEQLAQQAEQVYSQMGIESVDFEVFVDDDGLPRRVTSNAGDTLESTIDFLTFNEPVDIQYPSPDQITDMGDMGGLDTGGF